MDVECLTDDGTVIQNQIRDSAPKRIKALQFGILSSQDIFKQSVVHVSSRHVYDLNTGQGSGRTVAAHGPLDEHMGTSRPDSKCLTCGRALIDCNGHFGYVKLALPAFHIGYLKKIIEVLHCVCKGCSRVMLNDTPRRRYLKNLRRPGIDNMERKGIYKSFMAECRKCKVCPHCFAVNGSIRKVPGHALKVIHDKFRWFNQSNAKNKQPPSSKLKFDASFEQAKKGNPEIEKHMKKVVEDMNPLRVLNLFRLISDEDCELLGMHAVNARPEMLIWQHIPAPPVNIRPSVAQDSASTEDDITNKLGDIIQISNTIALDIAKGQPISTIMEHWDYLQIQIAMYINSEVPNLQQSGFGKPIRGFCQRLKGKQGRFRGNLSGKRVDFSGRTVISPDPNLGIDEVAVPERVAVNLYYPEKVNRCNIEKLQNCVKRGTKHPGANFIVKKNNRKVVLKVFNSSQLAKEADKLQIGDTVLRHLEDGDIVLFNRQPSLHKLSILCHRVKVRQYRTFRLNECVCTPYNADFDGDEMNLHVPQTEEARTEALELMGVKHNLATPKDGTPIIAATQDFVTAAYLLSSKDRFYDRKSFTQICSYMFDANGVKDPTKKIFTEEARSRNGILDIDLPPPTILKPEALWTGKQVFNILMRPSKKSKVLVNLDAGCKQFKPELGVPNDLNEDDAWLCVRNSEIMCGVMDKNTIGAGKKDSIFYVIMRDFGPDCAVQAMNRLAKLSARWLSNEGFSIGIDDVYPGSELVRRKRSLIEEAYAKCDELIKLFKEDKLARDAGCDEEQTMENKISGVLSEVRQKAGQICFDQLSKWNSPIIMAKSGSKGSNINVSQMVAAVGQQIIGGSRVADGFQDRTLPHFAKYARQPPSKGFVQNSFFSGLTPTEFIFHAMSGREGLVDTAVKTAETGYMSRRLMKSLEDLSAQYDDTVRNSSAGIVQFQFGEDGLDPLDMEGKAKPVNFARTFTHAQNLTWNNQERSLRPDELLEGTINLLQPEKDRVARRSLTDKPMDYHDQSNAAIDQYESKREFLQTIEKFMSTKADDLARTRTHLGASSGKVKTQDVDMDDEWRLKLAAGVAGVSQKSLDKFIKLCLSKYRKSKVEPGHAVGAVGAQSIGEPGTQMTLKTFHFAGVAGMSITQGVPRIKEIINGSKAISTPVIQCELVNKSSEIAARLVKSRIEKLLLKDVISNIEEVWSPHDAYVRVKIDTQHIRDAHLDLSVEEIRTALMRTRTLKIHPDDVRIEKAHLRIRVRTEDERKSGGRTKVPTRDEQEEYFIRVQNLKRGLPRVAIKGYPDATRAVITKTGTRDAHGREENMLLVEGYGLKACMTTSGVVGTKTQTNNIDEMHRVLGIEAARTSIIAELDAVMGKQMDIDPRHMQLLADVMTFKGDVLGITRFGLAKMRDSILQLASFEKTPDHLFDAAVKAQTDPIEGVSECIIMGQSMTVGTGAMKVIRDLAMGEGDFVRKPTVFEDLWVRKKGRR